MNNEEKILSILESMQTDIGGLKAGQDSLNAKVAGLEQGQNMIAKQVNELSAETKAVGESQVRMENELTEKVRALFDAREVQNDVNEKIMNTLDRIEAKVDVLQMETASIRRVK